MKIQAKFWQKRRLVLRTALEKTEPYWLQKCGFKDRESLERRSSAFMPLRRARIKRRDKILNKRGLMFFDTKYDEKKIASFNQMNTLLRCVLLFFILDAAPYMSYTAALPSSPEDLQTIEGRVIYVQTNKSRGASYYRLNLVDSALKQRRFSLDVYGTEIDGYKAAIYNKDVKI